MKRLIALFTALIVLLTSITAYADESFITVYATSGTFCSNPAVDSHTLTWWDWVAAGAPSNWEVTLEVTVTGNIPSNRAFAVTVRKNGSVVHAYEYRFAGTTYTYLPAAIGNTFEVKVCYDLIQGVSTSSPNAPVADPISCTAKMLY